MEAPLELPSELVIALGSAVAFLVAEGLQSLSRLLKIDLSGHQTALASVLVGLLVAIANGLIGLVPPEYLVWVRVLLGALVVIFGPAGIHSVLKKSRTQES